MIIYKRLLAILLLSSMLIGLTGCSTAENGRENAEQPSDKQGSSVETEKSSGIDLSKINPTGEKITLRVLENDTAKKEGYFAVLLEAFNKEFAQYNIEAVDADMDEYSDLAQNGPYGFGPDVLYQANDILMKYAADKHILPLNVEDFECYSYIPAASWDAFRLSKDGKAYICGIPVNIQEPMLYYRKDMLPMNWQTDWDRDGNNIPDFLENWNDMYAYSKLLRDTDSSPNRDSQYGIMLSYNDLYMNGEFFFSYGAKVFEQNVDGAFDVSRIGLGAGNTAKGLMGMRALAFLMNEGCIDDTITSNRYEKLANGTYRFAVSTPDTYILFVNKLKLQYEEEGLSSDEAYNKAVENLVMTEIPSKMPADGDFSKDAATMSDSDFVNSVVMGGVNGYGISSYTEHREASMAFVNFATSFSMINTRMEMLGIAPTRSDVAKASGGITEAIFTSLAEGRIYLMPSVKELNQVWTPVHTLLSDIAKDAYRENDESEKYRTEADMQAALDNVCKQVYDAIFTLAE